MAEQVRVDITATDNASKTLDKVADKVDDLESADVDIPVDADTTDAQRDVEGLLRKVEGLARDPAKIVLSSNAVQIEADILGLTAKLDKLDADDPDVTVTIDKINALQGDLDTVTNKLRDIDDLDVKPDVDTSGIDRAKKASGEAAETIQSGIGPLRGLTDEFGDSSSAAGTYANAVIDAGEAIQIFGGQLGLSEQALGRIATGLGVAGLAIGGLVAGWNALTASQKKATQQNKENLEDLFGALQDGKTIFEAFKKEVTEAGKFEFPGLGDILPEMNRLGISVQQFARLAQLPKPELEKWARAQGELTKGTPAYDDMKTVVFALANANANAATAEERHRATAQALGEDIQGLDQAYADAADSSTAFADAQQRGADMLDRVNTLLQDQAEALNEQADAALAAADSHIALDNAQRDAAEATQATIDAAVAAADATAKHGAASVEAADAQRTLDEAIRSERDAAIDAANAAVRYAADQAKAAGANQTATQRIDTANAALLEQAHNATPAARDAITDYIIEANKVPADKQTDIRAAIAAGDFVAAKAMLDEASAPRTATMQAEANTAAAERDLNYTARDREVMIRARLNPNYGADLGPIGPGPRSLPPEPAPAVGVVNMQLPAGWRGDPLAGVHGAVRRHGRLYRSTG